MCAKFLQKILNSTAVGACQSFRQITWFLGNNRALSTFRYRILQHLISIKMFFQMIKKNTTRESNDQQLAKARPLKMQSMQG